MTATEAPAVITAPCVVDGMSDETYRADPVPGGSLSSTGARKLIPPSTPAKFKYWLGKEQVKREFDVGHAAHMRVLGRGKEFVVTEFDNWTTKAAKAERDEVRASGRTPLLFEDGQRIEAMAAALFEHPLAKVLLDPDSGEAEKSLFWQDGETDEWLRARIDFMRHKGQGRRVAVDYKTARSAHEDAFQKSAFDYGYYLQCPFYLNGVRTLLDDDPVFLFVVQEVEPPFLVNVIELNEFAVHIGQLQIRLAIDTYAKCKRDDVWPGYVPEVQHVSLPPYIENRFKEVR